MDDVLLEITSHVLGKNAKVRVYRDRVEWERGGSVSGGKVTAAVLTLGMSAAVTGLTGRQGAGVEMIPMRAITSVTSRRDTMVNDTVSIITAGNTIEMRCGRAEAEALRSTIMWAMNAAAQPVMQQPMIQPQAPVGPPPGWYPDPQNQAIVRWWDGGRWTEHTQPRQG